jgi:mRNA-degrading endonuclease toxin of MazEF toxin-antitoxin module
VPRQSVVNLDSILTISTQQVHEFIVHFRPEKMHEVERAIHFALGLSY